MKTNFESSNLIQTNGPDPADVESIPMPVLQFASVTQWPARYRRLAILVSSRFIYKITRFDPIFFGLIVLDQTRLHDPDRLGPHAGAGQSFPKASFLRKKFASLSIRFRNGNFRSQNSNLKRIATRTRETHFRVLRKLISSESQPCRSSPDRIESVFRPKLIASL